MIVALYERIEQALARRGREPAIVFGAPTAPGDSAISGKELLDRARALAGVFSDAAPVAVLAHRSYETVASMLACLSVGVPWLPLDPGLPDGQIVDRLRSVGAGTLVVSASAAERGRLLAGHAGIGCTVADDPAASPSPGLPGQVHDGVAYLIQTSGTTGEPKTIAVPTAALENYVAGVLPLLGGVDGLRGRRLGLVTTLAADLGYTTVFAALVSGAELHLVPESVAHDPAAFVDYQRWHRLSVYKTTPSHLRALLAADPHGAFLPDDLLVCGGEAFTPDLADALVAVGAGCRVVNHYGPAETCIGVAAGEVPLTGPRGAYATVPVGPPLAGVRLHVVDERLRGLPPNTPGEVLIGGAQVSPGYLGAVALTAERFVPEPGGFAARAYRTGDLGALTETGELVVLGRIDRQRKVRGHRVEPAGIEAVLRRVPGVGDAAVDVRPVGDLGETLVAWVAADEDLTGQAIRRRLAESLPPYQVPTHVMVLRALPRTANGKVNTAALTLTTGLPDDSAVLDVAAVFAAALQTTELDPDADVFALGMHSLAVVRAVARVRLAGLGELSVRDVYQARTIRAIARLAAAGSRGAGMPAAGAAAAWETPATGFEPQQHALWLERARLGAGSAYDIPLRWALRGPTTMADLCSALERVVDGHPALRTRGELDSDHPRAVLHSRGDPVRGADLEAVPAAGYEAAVGRLLEQMHSGSDGLAPSPLRATVVRRSPTVHELLVVVDHAIFDGRSAEVLIDAALAVVVGAAMPTTAVTPQRPIGARTPAAQLPAPAGFGREPRAAGGAEPTRFAKELPAGLWGRAEQRAHGLGVSVFTLVLTVWAAVLGRQQGERDFTIATPVDLREDHGIGPDEPIVGCFVNTIPVVLGLDGSATLQAACERTAAAVAAALDDRLRPYPEHSAAMRAAHGVAQPARAMLTVERAPTRSAGALTAAPRPVGIPRAAADLDLVVTSYDAVTVATLHSGPGLPDASAALLNQFVTALTDVCAHPDRRIDDISLVSRHWRARLLDWGTGAAAAPRPDAVAPLRLYAAAHPHDTAVITPSAIWTYARLMALVDVYRAGLAAASVTAGSQVGVAIEMSAELMALWVATLESGAAVVALDPHWPAERIAQAVAVGRLDLLVAQAPTATVGCPVRTPDELTPAGQAVDAPQAVPATAAAYTILTSGSTGVPGAVVVSRGAVAGHLGWMDAEFPLSPADRVLLHTSPGFDVAVWELLGPVAQGAAAVIPPATERADLEGLARVVRTNRVSVLQTVPALLQALLEQPDLLGCAALRLIFCGGEEVPPALVEQVHRLLPAVTLVNAYGPTETTVDATCRVTVAGDGIRPRVPIGRPIGGATAYVVDELGRLLPPGAVGELAIGGAGVANGYLDDPTRTAARFVPDRHSGVPGSRLFRTGDRVRWMFDGQLDFLGRRDNQIQIRGQRVELEEVEAALVSHPAVRAAAVSMVGAGRDAQLVARLVPTDGLTVMDLQRHLAGRLPATAIPGRLLAVEAIPRLPNGKTDRAAASRLPGQALTASQASAMNPVEARVADVWAAVLGVRPSDPHLGFFDAGGNSLLILRLRARLVEEFAAALSVTDLFEHASVAAQARHLLGTAPDDADSADRPREQSPDFAVAVIGMACRTAGARTPAELWATVRDGVEAARRFTVEELVAAGVPRSLADDPDYVPVCAPLDAPYDFDAGFFRSTPEEAALTSPQHRLFLDCAWQALESAGVLARPGGRRIGVFAGSSEDSHPPAAAGGGGDQAERIAWELGNNQDFLVTRVAHLLDLRGPAMSVRTACSTSLVAVHLAVQALAAGECDTAVAGGVALRHPVRRGHRYDDGGIYARDGHCRPYDSAADGIISGDGAGAVVLKPLAAAIADGDHIHAVIRGSAVNNDGAAKTGFTAPSVSGQVDVVRAALVKARIDPTTIGYVEGHGTGTALGDPIEVTALTKAWRGRTDAVGVCSLGSLKANIGHTDAAAGVLGLIKTCLALEHGIIPGIPTLRTANPALRLEDTPFVVHRSSRPWPVARTPRRAAVHALGLGGTNAHVVLEQAPACSPVAEPHRRALVAPLSAPDEQSLHELAGACAEAFGSAPGSATAAARTLQRSRSTFRVRRAEVGVDADELTAALARSRAGLTAGSPDVVLMFPGGGSHRAGSGQRLYESVESFRAELDALRAPVEAILGMDLRELLWGRDSDRLAEPRLGFVANTAFGLAMAHTLRAFGVADVGVLGYSLGEVPAAAVAGVFDATGMLRIAALRGEIFERVSGGSSYVAAGAGRIQPLLHDQLVVGVVSGPDECVVSGPLDQLAEFEQQLVRRGVDHRRVAVPGAVHSPLLDPFLDEYRALVAQIGPAAPVAPLYSNITGAVLDAATAGTPDYWARQLRSTVQFGQCLQNATATGDTVLVDVGPGRGLLSIASGGVRGAGVLSCAAMGGSRDTRPEDVVLARCLADLWERGVPVDWRAWSRSVQRDVPMPVTPLRRLPLPPARSTHSGPAVPAPTVCGSVRLWERVWHQVPVRRGRPNDPLRLVFLGDGGAGHREYADRARAAGAHVVSARAVAEAWHSVAGDPDHRTWVVDLRPLVGAPISAVLELLAAAPPTGARICVVVDGACDVFGAEILDPSAALAGPAGLAVRQERPGVQVLTLDAGGCAAAPELLPEVLAAPRIPAALAVRGTTLWQPVVAPVDEPAPPEAVLRHGGVYVLTGGLGRYGRWIAERLAHDVGATVVLAQRTPLDVAGAEGDRRRGAVDRIAAAGGHVEVVTLDVTDESALGALLDDVGGRHGAVHGVIHCAGDIDSAAGFAPLEDLVGLGLAVAVETQSAAKIVGTEALRRALRGRGVDFCVLMSSNAALLSGPGLAVYGPVNAYQHVVAQQERRAGEPWVSIGWDGWRLPEDGERSGRRSSLDEVALSGLDAFDALLRCIRVGRGSVFVSPGDLADRYAQWVCQVGADPTAPADSPGPADGVGAQRSEALEDGVLGAVRAIWAELVAAAGSGPDDDLFDLGGTSLTVLRLRARLRDRLGADIPLAQLMENRTLAAMAGLVEAAVAEPAASGPVDAPTAPAPDEDADDIFTILRGLNDIATVPATAANNDRSES